MAEECKSILTGTTSALTVTAGNGGPYIRSDVARGAITVLVKTALIVVVVAENVTTAQMIKRGDTT